MIIVCVIIIICIFFAIFFAILINSLNCNNFIYGGNKKLNKFTANNDDPSGWQLYLSTVCGHCIEQKNKLYGFHTYAEYNEHGKLVTNNINGKLYPIEKIDAFPFWYNTKTKKTKLGKLDLNELCKLSPKIKSINCLL